MTKIAIKSDKITPFGGIFWGHAPIWPLALAGHWFYPQGEVQILRILVQRNPALAHVHLLLRRLMRWGPQLTPYKPPFASPKAPHLQRRHHSKGDKRACSEQHILRFGCRQTICFQYGRKAQWVDVQLLDGNRATQGRRAVRPRLWPPVHRGGKVRIQADIQEITNLIKSQPIKPQQTKLRIWG